jgi:hypothetical protein
MALVKPTTRQTLAQVIATVKIDPPVQAESCQIQTQINQMLIYLCQK